MYVTSKVRCTAPERRNISANNSSRFCFNCTILYLSDKYVDLAFANYSTGLEAKTFCELRYRTRKLRLCELCERALSLLFSPSPLSVPLFLSACLVCLPVCLFCFPKHTTAARLFKERTSVKYNVLLK